MLKRPASLDIPYNKDYVGFVPCLVKEPLEKTPIVTAGTVPYPLFSRGEPTLMAVSAHLFSKKFSLHERAAQRIGYERG